MILPSTSGNFRRRFVLSSAIAGTMAANGSGLQWATVRNIAMVWVLTLPAAMLLSGFLYLVPFLTQNLSDLTQENGCSSASASCLFSE